MGWDGGRMVGSSERRPYPGRNLFFLAFSFVSSSSGLWSGVFSVLP